MATCSSLPTSNVSWGKLNRLSQTILLCFSFFLMRITEQSRSWCNPRSSCLLYVTPFVLRSLLVSNTADYTVPSHTGTQAPLSRYKWTLRSCMRIAGNELQPWVLSLFYNNICCCHSLAYSQSESVSFTWINLSQTPGCTESQNWRGHYFLSLLCWHSVFAVWLGDCSDKLVLPPTVFHWNHNEQSPHSALPPCHCKSWIFESHLSVAPWSRVVVAFLFPVKNSPLHVMSGRLSSLSPPPPLECSHCWFSTFSFYPIKTRPRAA